MKRIKSEIMEVLHSCGFKGVLDFKYSIIHPHLLKITLPLGAISGIIETYIGVKSLTLFAFVVLIFTELVTGVAASVWVRKQKFSSMKFKRFGLKLTLWLVLLFVVFSFANEYKVDSWGRLLWGATHQGILTYVSMEYLMSVIENIGAISGKTKSPLIRFLRGQMGRYMDMTGESGKGNEQ